MSQDNCDPCRFCQHYAEFEDRSTGWVDQSCNAEEEEFPVMNGSTPCPYFVPFLASDGLFEQLADEQEQREWEEMMKEVL